MILCKQTPLAFSFSICVHIFFSFTSVPTILFFPLPLSYNVLVPFLKVSALLPLQDLKDLMRRIADVTYANAHADRRNEG